MNIAKSNTGFGFIFLLFYAAGYAQNSETDSLKKLLQTQKQDTNKVNLLSEISFVSLASLPDTAVLYAQQALRLAENLRYQPGVLNAALSLTDAYTTTGNYPMAIDFGFKALALAKETNLPLNMIWANARLAQCYYYLDDYSTSLQYDRNIFTIVDNSFPDSIAFICTDLSRVFDGMNQPDSALLYAQKSFKQIKAWHYEGWYTVIYPVLGNAFAGMGLYDSALIYYRTGIPVAVKNNATTDIIDSYNGIAKVYKAKANPDSAIWYANKVFAEKTAISYPIGLLKAANLLAEMYELKKNPDSTLKYLRQAISIKDSLFNHNKTVAIQNLVYKEQEKQQAITASRLKLQNQFWLFLLLAGAVAAVTIAVIILKNKRQQQLQDMRNSIADDLHDDIGSTLSSISIMSELAKNKSPEAASLLNSIGESALSIQENMSDIVWAVNPKNDRFENIVQRMNQFASEMLDTNNTQLDFSTSPDLMASKLTMEQRKNLYLFFKEAVNNAAKYAHAKNVWINIGKKEHHIKMIIRDNGKGFDTSQQYDGNGMSSLRKRAADLNASLKIRSIINEGTEVQISFKIT
ncbi:histidine kinase [Ferruginibacter paludis]|uniref:tetratricopeptide repeat-containing sensor histidine kinase n=1 Tax=Ferruginibacter paludis TaxID=1310417 RepID=UPI0025B3E9E9|nr:ATP-binding protein [Ferruginibacter paludis]MDN3655530.1 histidine kinase [Ferruginibacter paludis]